MLGGLFSCYTLNAQPPVRDFYSMITGSPVGKKVLVTDFIYDGSQLKRVQKARTKFRKPKERVSRRNELISRALDSMDFIDYREDTVCVIATMYLPTQSISLEILTSRGAVHVTEDCRVKSMSSYYEDFPVLWSADSVLYKTLFDWDLNKIENHIKTLGGLYLTEYRKSATRIILKDYRIRKKEYINFEPARGSF